MSLVLTPRPPGSLDIPGAVTGSILRFDGTQWSGSTNVLLDNGTNDGLNPALVVKDAVIGTGLFRSTIYGTQYNATAGVQKSVLKLAGTGRGASGIFGGHGAAAIRGLDVLMQDASQVVAKPITNCANNGSGLIRVTASAHTLSNGDAVVVYGVTGTTEANGSWVVTVVDANRVDLQGSTFTNAYVSGGTISNRASMEGIFVAVSTGADRGPPGVSGTGANFDDLVAVAAQNQSPGPAGKASECFYVGGSSMITGSAWLSGFACDANADWGLTLGNAGNTFAVGGIDLAKGVYTAGTAIRLPNNVPIKGRNAANSADVSLLRVGANDTLTFDTNISIADGAGIFLGTGTGTVIGAATSHKLAFFGATPVVQQSTIGTATGYAAGATAATFHSDDTYTGNVGSTAYTINGVVAALKRLGLVAQ
jgi:hypothetical protein